MLRRPAWFPWLPLAGNVAIYAALALVATSPELGVLRFVSWPLLGLVLAGCLAAGHDCSHLGLFRGRRANRVAGAMFSSVVLTNFTATKLAHMVHHRHTRVDGDSEHRLSFDSLGHYCWFMLAPFAIPRSAWRSLRMAAGRDEPAYAKTDRQRREVRADAVGIAGWLAIALALTGFMPGVMLCAYWGPLMFFWPAALFVAIPEHYTCDDGPDARAATRSTTSNWFVRWVLWNSNYHTEHHLHPSVPACNLPRVHRAERSSLTHCESSYLRFHARACVRLMRSKGV